MSPESRTVEPLFEHGDIVVRRDSHAERGTILGTAQWLADRYFYSAQLRVLKLYTFSTSTIRSMCSVRRLLSSSAHFR